MTLAELIGIARTDFLFDVVSLNYNWSSSYLAQLFTQAEREACKRASLILDKTTQTADNVASGTATSTTANKLVDTGAAFTTAMVGKTVYNSTDNTWATISARDSGTALSLSADIMVSGESYVVGDASKALTRICVVDGTAAYALSEKVIKIERCYLSSRGKGYPLIQQFDINSSLVGIPTWYTEEKKLITLYPEPDSSINSGTGIDTLNLEVYRLPLADLTMDDDTASPEIDSEFHFDLIHFVCAKAFMKDDEAINMTKAQWHEAQFNAKFGPPVSFTSETIMRKIPSNFKLSRSDFGL